MRHQGEQIRQAILQALVSHPGTNPTATLQKRFSVSREAIRRQLKTLTATGFIREEGYGKGRRYHLVASQIFPQPAQIFRISYQELKKGGEADIYQRYIFPFLQAAHVSANNLNRVSYTATEILNNVIDHSSSKTVILSMEISNHTLQLIIEDDGVGVFETLRNFFSLDGYFEAAGELAKGKRTTDPSKHAGEGLFFSARIADSFLIEANGIKYSYIEKIDDWSIATSNQTKGAKLTLTFDLNSPKSTKDIFDKYTDDFNFQQNSPRLVLPYIIKMPYGDFPSRSEAKKILAGAEKFKSIVIDFKDVESIGQGFADEIFRVFQNSHPDINIEFKNANPFVERMIKHVST